jgi:hypothetical protein
MRKIYVVLSVFIFAFFVSCGTTSNVFDASLPPTETATLTFSAEWTVKSYNGISVELKKPALGSTGFTIPAGETEIVMDLRYREQRGNYGTVYTAEDVLFNYNFQAGHEYIILFQWVDEEGNIPTVQFGHIGTKPSLLISDPKDVRNPLFIQEMSFE